MAQRERTSVQSEMISYDKIDPLPTENPFYFNEDSKINTIIKEKEKNFPWIHMSSFIIIIPLLTFLMGLFYIGGIWNPVKKMENLKYVIVNEDVGCNIDSVCGAMKGQNIGEFYGKLDGQGAGTFEVIKGTMDDATELINKHKYWMALHVPNNFTFGVLANLNDNTTKTEVVVNRIYDEARSYTTMNFVKKAFEKLQTGFHTELITKLESLSKLMGNPKKFNPPFIIEGITYNDKNLYPVSVYGQYFCTFVSFILIWIGTIATSLITHFVFPLESHWIEKKDATNAIVKTICAKTITSVALLFAICAIISIIPLCCGSMIMKKGYASVFFFFFFFSLSGIGVNNLLIHLFHFINFYLIACTFMILQFITCGGVIHHDLQYRFFKIGKAFPMYYATREIKYIYFGSGKHTQTENILIIFAWVIVTVIASYYLYYLELNVKRAKYLKRNSINK